MLGNLILETVSAPGTGTLTLLGAATGRVAFSFVFANGTQIYYAIEDGTQAEIGVGTYSAGTLSRDSVLWNSSVGSSSPGRLNFTGTARVYNTLPSSQTLFRDVAGNMAMGSKNITGLADAANDTDAAAFGQIGWRVLAKTTIGSAVGGANFTLPSGLTRFRLEYQHLTQSISSALFMRFSSNGGSTFYNGSTDYTVSVQDVKSIGANCFGGNGNSMEIAPVGTAALFGSIEFESTGVKAALFDSNQFTTEWLRRSGVGACNQAAAMDTVRLFSTGNFTAGVIRLLGAKL